MEAVMDFKGIVVRPIERAEVSVFQKLMQAHHYLGALPKIGNTIRYVATYQDDWLALIVFSAAALKCGARDNWIGWKYRYQYDRLNLLANNSRFLIFPGYHFKNLASKILSLCQRRIQNDWLNHFGSPLLLLETFVDPTRFHGTIYKASNWHFVGTTKGYQRIRGGYSDKNNSGKMVFVRPLQRDAITILSHPILEKYYQTGGRNMRLNADQMKSLPDFFRNIIDPRRGQGRRHRLEVVLAISAAAILCGMAGYKEIPDHETVDGIEHGRIQTRKIWVTIDLNDYLDFPHAGQAFMIKRQSYDKKTGKTSNETAYGVTSLRPNQADAEKVLQINRGHWVIENSCHYIIDWNYNEDKSRVRVGSGPENLTRLRRFAVGLIKSKNVKSVSQKMRQLLLNRRAVFEYLKLSRNSQAHCNAY